jgi:hypothetical protein
LEHESSLVTEHGPVLESVVGTADWRSEALGSTICLDGPRDLYAVPEYRTYKQVHVLVESSHRAQNEGSVGAGLTLLATLPVSDAVELNVDESITVN